MDRDNDLNQSKTLDAGAGTVYTSSLSFGGRNTLMVLE